MGKGNSSYKAVKVIGGLSNYTSFGKRLVKPSNKLLDKPIIPIVRTTEGIPDLFLGVEKADNYVLLGSSGEAHNRSVEGSKSLLDVVGMTSANMSEPIEHGRKKSLRRLAEDTLKEILESSSSPAATRASAARTLLELTGAIGRSKTDDISASDIPDFENMTAEDIDRELTALRRKLGEV